MRWLGCSRSTSPQAEVSFGILSSIVPVRGVLTRVRRLGSAAFFASASSASPLSHRLGPRMASGGLRWLGGLRHISTSGSPEWWRDSKGQPWRLSATVVGPPALRPRRNVSPAPQSAAAVIGDRSRKPGSSASWWARCFVTPRSSAISTSLIGVWDRRGRRCPHHSSVVSQGEVLRFAPTSRSSLRSLFPDPSRPAKTPGRQRRVRTDRCPGSSPRL
jgi:hypothetical protein